MVDDATSRLRLASVGPRVVVAAISAAVGALLVLTLVPADHRVVAGAGAGAGSGRTETGSLGPFTIGGDLRRPMAPGRRVPLNLTVDNPYDRELIVHAVAVRIVGVRAPRATGALPCTVDDFEVTQVPSSVELTVPASRAGTLDSLGLRRELWPTVGMVNRDVNQNGCVHATLTLGFSAVGNGRP
ncbi:MAG: hypothetical protein ACR2LI_04400 [Propionibacteriaceae bacterium]